MPEPPPPLPAGGQGNGGVELLTKVKLLSFTAVPDHIVPFESSTLRWQVQTPGGVTFSLDGFVSPVSAVGMQVVQPVITSDFMLQARARQAETTLGTVTVTVDTSQCVPQTRQDCAGQIADDLAAGILIALQNHGRKGTFDYVHGVSGSITPGQIAYDLKGTIGVLGITVNDELTGGFGLTVDLSRDQLAPTNESHNVNCSVDAGTWAALIAAGAGAGAVVGGAAGLIGGPFGLGIGLIAGAIVGIVTVAANLQWLINTVSNEISAAIPGGIPILVQQIIAKFFSEPAGMALATVSIDPDPPNAPEGNITVTFCPKGGSPGGGGVLA